LLKIAVLEDDPAQAELITTWLREEEHQVVHADRCKSFLDMFLRESPDLIILDWQLPDGSGIDVLETIRGRLESKVPAIFCTQRNAEEDIVKALKLGADDYLTKPLRRAELMARIQALGRRAGFKKPDSVLNLGPICVDTEKKTITIDGKPAKLTHKDYAVAHCLISNQGKVLSREYLLKQVWGVDSGLDTRTVDVHVSRVRRALGIGPDIGFIIKTVYQHGYRLEAI